MGWIADWITVSWTPAFISLLPDWRHNVTCCLPFGTGWMCSLWLWALCSSLELSHKKRQPERMRVISCKLVEEPLPGAQLLSADWETKLLTLLTPVSFCCLVCWLLTWGVGWLFTECLWCLISFSVQSFESPHHNLLDSHLWVLYPMDPGSAS